MRLKNCACQNDEFKRIPSETTDTTTFLKSLNMGSREGLEKFITADEYLKMKAHVSSSSDKTDSDSSHRVSEVWMITFIRL